MKQTDDDLKHKYWQPYFNKRQLHFIDSAWTVYRLHEITSTHGWWECVCVCVHENVYRWFHLIGWKANTNEGIMASRAIQFIHLENILKTTTTSLTGRNKECVHIPMRRKARKKSEPWKQKRLSIPTTRNAYHTTIRTFNMMLSLVCTLEPAHFVKQIDNYINKFMIYFSLITGKKAQVAYLYVVSQRKIPHEIFTTKI